MRSPTAPSRPSSLPPPEAGPVVTHPRIRARRVEVLRHEGRRRLHRVVALLAVVAIAGGAAGSTRTPLLDVDRISVVGASRTGTKAVAEATGVAIGDPMTDVNSGAVVARVETLPWVERASVQRLWPATLRIRVAERTPAAQILAGNRVILIDESGRLLASRPEPAPGLVAIEGLRGGAPGERIPAARPVLEVVAALPAALATEVTAARPVPGGLELVLDRDIVVRFGPAAAIEEKLDALAAVLAGADLSDAAVIDVRVPRAPVTLTGGPGGA